MIKDFKVIDNVICMCDNHKFFINDDCKHVATGNIEIFENAKLKNILTKASIYREPEDLDFDLAHKTIVKNVDLVIQNWIEKEKLAQLCSNGWKQRFLELLTDEVASLKNSTIEMVRLVWSSLISLL